MRILITSDLHFSPQHHDAVMDWALRAAALNADLLVVAGDVGEGPAAFAGCLDALRDVAPTRAVLPGNHDVWSRGDAPGSRALLDEVMPYMARARDWIWLEEDVVRVGDVAVVGSMAWYDYSAADPRLGLDAAAYAARKGEVNADAWYTRWPERDVEVAARLGAAMMGRLQAVVDAGAEEVVVVTHVPLFECSMNRRALEAPDAARWNMGNAYFGNLTLGAQVAAVPQVRHVVSGHSHIGGDETLARAGMSALRVQVVASEYGAPAHVLLEV